MNTITKNDFLNWAVDCQGYSEADALELAEDYKDSYVEYFTDLGVLDDALSFFSK